MVITILIGFATIAVIALVAFLICSGFSVAEDGKMDALFLPLILAGIVVFLLIAYTLGLGTKQVFANFRAWCAEGAQEQQK